MYLLEEGIAPERVDRVIKEKFGFAMGPFATFDLSGLDVFYLIGKERTDAAEEKRTEIIDRMYELKRWGQKTGLGFFKYDGPNKREGLPDPTVLEIAAAEAAKAGIKPRTVSDDEIIERLIYALVNRGADLLDKEIALRPGDEDIVFIYGYGFPPHRGGPMWYADEVGVAKVVARMKEFGWTVSPLLERIAADGGTIAGYTKELAHA
jgi:3-hydroxyacyl-CoA dehydrogenase